MRKIIWFDDRHALREYDTYTPRFKKCGYELLMISDLSKFFNNDIDKTITAEETACIILDMSWRDAIRDGFDEHNGPEVGMELFEKLMKSSLKEVKKIVYTIAKNDEDVQLFCKKYDLLNFSKSGCHGDEFVSSVIQVINQ